MAARIEWSPDGNRVLICRDGTLELRALDGRVLRELPIRPIDRSYLDARWLADGRIVAIDRFGLPVTFMMNGEPYDAMDTPWHTVQAASFASIAGHGFAFALIKMQRLSIHAIAGRQEWTLADYEREAKTRAGTPISAALSPDGRSVAIATESRDVRQWLVLALAAQKNPRDGWRATLIDRTSIVPAAPAIPRCVLGDSRRQITNADGATALALDASETRIARAFASTLRVDYADGQSASIEPGIGPLASLAFGPDDRIACLAADGTFEIVPIP